MRSITRTIREARELRGDLSTYLIHLTRTQSRKMKDGTYRTVPAKRILENILRQDTMYGLSPVGQFNHYWYKQVNKDTDLRAVCFTEAPINQIYLFVGIQGRALNFESYGLVFDKDEIAKAPVHAAPVLYFSQPDTKDFHFVNTFNQLETKHYADFKDVLYLFDRFGKDARGVDYDWRWEREWRIKGEFDDIKKYVKFGLCPESDIDDLERQFCPIKFVDPFFHPDQIRTKLSREGIL